MRNVTIVESNVEPNKEHLWFYNGKLKWFGPNGWEDICVCKSPSPSSTTTTTPKPVVPPATTTTTTSTTPGPGVATTPIGMRVYNYMDAIIDITVFGANSVSRPIPANGDVYIEGVYPSTSGGNITLYIKVRDSGSISPDIQVNRILDINIMGEISGTSIEQFKSILNKGTIDIPYAGSDALHSISLVVSISDGDTTTTTTTTSSTTSTPTPNSIKFTNKTSVPLTLTRVNSVDEGLSSPPIQPNQYYILVHNANDTDTDSYIDMFAIPESGVLPPFSSLKITAFNNEGQEYDVPYEHYQDAMGINFYKFSFKELINKRVTEVFIYGSLEETTTTSTTSTTTPPSPPKKIGLSNQVYPNTTLGVAITANNLNNISPSELQSIRSGSYTSIDDYPTLTRKYLAVVRPKDSNYSKEAIVAEIVLVGTDYGEGQYSLYPIETIEDDSNKSFLFDLSKKPVDTPYIEQVNLYSYNSITMSTIPPFIDGNIPPLADEK